MAKSISQLTTQATANESDLFEVAIADAHSASGCASKKESAAVIAEGIVNQYTYPLGMPHMQNKTILGAINQLLANFAAVYDDTATYSEGDFRTYNGQLYKCNTDISTAETFDPTKWDAVTLADNLGSGGGGGGIDYSTTEQDTGLKWIDGKPIYQITAQATSLPNNSSIYLTTPANVKNLIDSWGFAYSSSQSAGYSRTMPFAAGGSNDLRIDLNESKFRVMTFSNWSSYGAYVTFQYTKTTD